MSRPVNIMLKVLTMWERTGWVCPVLAKWMTDFQFDQYMKAILGKPIEHCLMIDYQHNFIPAAAARNVIANQVKGGGAPNLDWLLMIDNDMAPQANLLDTIKDAPADADIIVPRFSMWDEGKASVTLCWGLDASPTKQIRKVNGREFYTFEKGAEGFFPLSKCGTGCIFIKPHVFDRINPPYFSYPLNDDQGIKGTEDITFTEKVVKAGMKIYGNAGVVVGHYHNCNLEIMAHAVHLAKLEAVEEYKKEVLTDHAILVVSKAECPSDSSVAVASPV